MKQKITFFKVLLTLVLLCGVGNAWGETKKEGFEKASTSTNYQGTVTVESTKSDCGIGWKIYYGTVSTSSKISGNNSAALRLYTSDNYGYIMTTTPIEGLTKVSFNVKAAETKNAKILYDVFCSADKETWTIIGSKIAPGTTADNKSYAVKEGSKYIKIEINSNSTKPTSGNAQLTIDDVEFTYTVPQADPFVVTFNAGTNGTCSTSSLTEASTGAGITLPSCTASDGYVFKGWSTTENGTTADAGMAGATYKPSSDCTLYAVYKKLYTVTYYSLGVQLGYEKVEESGTVAKAPSFVTPPTGWTFAGWTTDEDYAMSATAPDLFTETTPVDDDYILYAVFSKTEGGTPAQAKLTNADIQNIEGSYKTGKVTTTDGDWNYNACTQTNTATNVKYLQIRKNSTLSYVQIPELSGNITSIVLEDVVNASNGTFTGDIYFRAECSNDAEALATANAAAANDDVTLTIPTGVTTGYIMASAACRFQSITVNYSSGTTCYTTNEPQTQPVTISEACYATAFIPFAATVEGATAYYVTVSGDKAKLNEIEGTIPANTGVVLKGSAGTVTFTESVGNLANVEGNLLIGTAKEGGENFEDDGFTYYILSNGTNGIGFYWDGENYYDFEGMGAHCAQYKAVLAVPNMSAGTPSFFTFDDATAINAISSVKASGVRYNLNGQAVGEDYKGIVIVNGKKMFNK